MLCYAYRYQWRDARKGKNYMANQTANKNGAVDPYADEGWSEAPQEALIKFDTVGDVLMGQITQFTTTENNVPQIHFNSPQHGMCFVNAGKDLERQVKAIGAKVGWYLKIELTGLQDVLNRESKLMLFKVQYKKP